MRISPQYFQNNAVMTMTRRRLTAFSKLNIFWVITELGEDFTVKTPNFATMISTLRLPK